MWEGRPKRGRPGRLPGAIRGLVTNECNPHPEAKGYVYAVPDPPHMVKNYRTHGGMIVDNQELVALTTVICDNAMHCSVWALLRHLRQGDADSDRAMLK